MSFYRIGCLPGTCALAHHAAERRPSGRWRRLVFISIFLPHLALRADQTIYDDMLENGWQNWSWATVNLANTNPVHSGTYSISVACSAYSALYLENNSFNAGLYTNLTFWINGGVGGQSLTVFGLTNNAIPGQSYTFTAPTGAWQKIVVPLSALGLTNQTNTDGFWIYNSSGSALPAFYVDDISLVANGASSAANVIINATNVINTVPANAFGIFMAVWDTWGSETPAEIHQAGVTAMRYPGGGYADNYRWSAYQMTPDDGQAGNLGYLSGSTDMGHFIQLMSNAQAQAVISVDWGSGFLWNADKTAMAIPDTNGAPQEAAAWVAYANASTNIYGTTNDVTIGVDAEGNNWQTAGYWAMMRAASPLDRDDGYNFLRISHPAPVGINYWEVGNEPYGDGYYGGGDGYECDYAVPYPSTNFNRDANALLSPVAYGQAVKAFSIAMKAVDPTIKVGAYSSTPPADYSWDYLEGINNGQHWTPQVLAQCGSNIDFLIVHWYPNFSDNLGADLLSEVGSTIPVMMNGTGPYPHTGTNSGLEDWITNYCPNPANVQILVTEFGADNYPYLVAGTNGMPILGPVEALFAADCYSTWLDYPAFANADWLDFDADSFLGNGNGPVVYAMQMLRHLCNPGDAIVQAASDTGDLRVQGVVRQDGNLGILLINESLNNSQTVDVTVSNANLNATGTIYQFGTGNWTSTNEVPATGPGSNSISSVGNTFGVTLPAYTMDVLVIPVLGETPPTLAAIPNYTENAGQTVAFAASATDTNEPPPALTFALLAGATNATLNANSGAFSFRPLVTQANSTNNFTLRVSANGPTGLSATQTFYVVVNPLSAPGISNISFFGGLFGFSVSGQAGPDYAVQTSSNLLQWNNVFITNPLALPFAWADTNSPAAPQRFYRVQLGPPLP